jgi:hypothetical protein
MGIGSGIRKKPIPDPGGLKGTKNDYQNLTRTSETWFLLASKYQGCGSGLVAPQPTHFIVAVVKRQNEKTGTPPRFFVLQPPIFFHAIHVKAAFRIRMFIPDPNPFHPGSQIRIKEIIKNCF